MGPRVSVVIPTLGRKAEVEALLQSIVHSSLSSVEVLLVDQNAQDILSELVARYSTALAIKHLRVCLRGAALARNYGAQFAEGDIICFPDDDSRFGEETLDRACQIMDASGSEVVFGRAMTLDGKDAITLFDTEPGYLKLGREEGKFTEFTMFARKETFDHFRYDESFGVGAFYGAEEAHDLVLRFLQAGVKLYYSPQIVLYHPQKVIEHHRSAEIQRAFKYRCGFAHLCMKHRLYAKLTKRLGLVMVYLCYLALFDRGKVRYYSAEFLGLLTGIVVR